MLKGVALLLVPLLFAKISLMLLLEGKRGLGNRSAKRAGFAEPDSQARQLR